MPYLAIVALHVRTEGSDNFHWNRRYTTAKIHKQITYTCFIKYVSLPRSCDLQFSKAVQQGTWVTDLHKYSVKSSSVPSPSAIS